MARNWTRAEAADLLRDHQTIGPVADDEGQLMDGDGENICQANPGRRSFLESPEEMASLIAFVLNDYPDAVDG